MTKHYIEENIYTFRDNMRRQLVMHIKKDLITPIEHYPGDDDYGEKYSQIQIPLRDLYTTLIPIIEPELAKAKGKIKEKMRAVITLLETILDD